MVYFNETKYNEWVEKILEKQIPYIGFATKRAFLISYKNFPDIDSKAALLLKTPQIAIHYLKNQDFPDIQLICDILENDIELNNYIQELFNAIIYFIQLKQPEADAAQLYQKFFQKLHISTTAINDAGISVNPDLQNVIEVENGFSLIKFRTMMESASQKQVTFATAPFTGSIDEETVNKIIKFIVENPELEVLTRILLFSQKHKPLNRIYNQLIYSILSMIYSEQPLYDFEINVMSCYFGVDLYYEFKILQNKAPSWARIFPRESVDSREEIEKIIYDAAIDYEESLLANAADASKNIETANLDKYSLLNLSNQNKVSLHMEHKDGLYTTYARPDCLSLLIYPEKFKEDWGLASLFLHRNFKVPTAHNLIKKKIRFPYQELASTLVDILREHPNLEKIILDWRIIY